MKQIAYRAIAAALVAAAVATGAWLGYFEDSATPSTESIATASKQPGNETPGPKILLPRPVRDVATLTTSKDVDKNGTSRTTASSTDPATDVVPGGGATENSIERLWETNLSKAWAVRATPLTRPNWYITGVVQRGEKTQVIVQFEGEQQPRFLKIGDMLPGGGKLAWVRDNAIGVITPDKKIVGVSVRSDEWEPQTKTPSGNAPRSSNKPGGTVR